MTFRIGLEVRFYARGIMRGLNISFAWDRQRRFANTESLGIFAAISTYLGAI